MEKKGREVGMEGQNRRRCPVRRYMVFFLFFLVYYFIFCYNCYTCGY